MVFWLKLVFYFLSGGFGGEGGHSGHEGSYKHKKIYVNMLFLQSHNAHVC